MHHEIQSAADFLVSLMKKSPSADLTDAKIAAFVGSFTTVAAAKFAGHWDRSQPLRGNGFRAIRSVPGKPDPLLVRAGAAAGLALSSLLPPVLTLWIDPADVCGRIGSDGSVFRVDPTSTAPLAPASATPAAAVLANSPPLFAAVAPASSARPGQRDAGLAGARGLNAGALSFAHPHHHPHAQRHFYSHHQTLVSVMA